MTAILTSIAFLVLVLGGLFGYGLLSGRGEASKVFAVCFTGAALLLCANAAGFISFRPDPQIALQKSEWRCAASHTETESSLMPVGEVMIPTTSDKTVCDRYERR